MRVSISEDNLEFFEALASPVRLKIIGCLSKRSMNIKELAENVGVSSAIMTSHIKKLESAHLVESKKSKQYGKVCSLVGTNYMLLFPTPRLAVTHYDVNLKVGQYTRAEISPTCGIATEHSVIGDYDDPRCFYDPRRENAELIWFSKGYVEYYIPNYVPDDCQVTSIEICAEMCSEYPDVKIDAVSDIDLFLNDEHLCTWQSPGDFGDRRGRYTPSWWHAGQYGILKRYEINSFGVYLDKELKAEKPLCHFHTEKDYWTLRFAVNEDSGTPGGLTLFGSTFGDYPQDIYVCVRYE